MSPKQYFHLSKPITNFTLIKERNFKERQLIIIDISGPLAQAQATHSRKAIERLVSISEGDMVLLGGTGRSLLEAGLVWRGSRLVLGANTYEATSALTTVLTDENIDERFGRLVLVTGKAAFAEPAASLRASGVDVTVVSQRVECAGRLQMSATRTLFFDDDPVSAKAELIVDAA